MTLLDSPPLEAPVAEGAFRSDPEAAAPTAPPPEDHDYDRPLDVPVRPLLVAAASTVAAALMTGGMFDSLLARPLCVVAGLGGVGWAWLALRSPRRRALLANAFPLVLAAASLASLAVAAEGGPSNLPRLVAEVAGTKLRPPVPFDPGWRPVLIAVLGLLGFAAAWMAALSDRPQLGFALPLPVLGLTAVNQPEQGQLVSGLLGLLPLVAGLGVVFGGGAAGRARLDRTFEVKRAVRSLAAVLPAVGALVLLNSTTSFLFPEPAYDPSSKPQKPKPQPLSAAEDRVLFEVAGPITGPWKLGVLDTYDGKAWKLPAITAKEQQKVTGSGTLSTVREGTTQVQITVRDLGSGSTAPGVVGPASYAGPPGTTLLYDRRAGVLRVPSGRVPSGLTYALSLPPYPTAGQLRLSPVATGVDPDLLSIPPPPPAVDTLLAGAPGNPWDRFSVLLEALTSVEVAVGEGRPTDITPDKVQELLAGDHEGSPYELVAAQAMLARWAGVPSRIGFGFDGVNIESGVSTVRPKNAAQWLEVYFEGYGWVPIVTAPPKAKASLDNEEAKQNPTIQAGADVAVELYIPVRRDTFRQLYERVRSVLLLLSPFAGAALAGYLGTPAAKRAWRRMKRDRWAEQSGPTAQIAVAYAELRDLATDLGVGDPYATPLEFLDHLAVDEEHEELAWLVSRSLYGDLAGRAGTAEAAAAHELSLSLRRRLRRGQPYQNRVIGVLSRSSLLEPYTEEVPNVRSLPRLEVRRSLATALGRPRRAGRAALARWHARQASSRLRRVGAAGERT